MRKSLIAILLVQGLTACASVSQAVSAYGAVAVTGAKAANDQIIEANKVALCAIPLSALARHRELIPAVKSLCVEPGDKELTALLDTVVTP